MPLMNRVISNLFGGVSQQAAGVRMDNQCEELINAYPSIADGLVKRPPSEFIATLTAGSAPLVGYLFIADTDNNRIVKRLADDLSYVSQVGESPGAGDNQFITPWSVCFYGDFIYVADTGNNRVVKRSASGLAYVAQATGFSSPNSICTDGLYIYTVDAGNHRITKHLCSNLSFILAWGTYTGDPTAGLNGPEGISTDGTYLYVGDHASEFFIKLRCSDLSYVSHISRNGIDNTETGEYRGSTTDGTFVWVTQSGNVDGNPQNLQKRNCSDLSAGGSPVWVVGSVGSGDMNFNSSRAITLGGTHLYITDTVNHRIKKHLASDGSYVSQLGSFGLGDDGFSSPRGVAYGGVR